MYKCKNFLKGNKDIINKSCKNTKNNTTNSWNKETDDSPF